MDIEFLLWLQNLRIAAGGVLDALMEGASDFVIGTWTYIILGFIYWCIDKKAGSRMLLTLGGGSVVLQFMKNTFCVYRPWIRDFRIIPAGESIKTATGYSFPSGHTYIATSIFGSIAIWQRKRVWLSAVCGACVLLVMFSRMYLGVHTPADVITSIFLCLICIWLSNKLLTWADGGKRRDLIVLISGLVICAAFLIYCKIKPYPIDYKPDGSVLVDPFEMITDCYLAAGTLIGFLLGWTVERHFVKFAETTDWRVRTVRLLVGAVTSFVFVKFGFEQIILALGVHWGNLVSFAIVIFWVMAGVPALFGLIEKITGMRK